MTRHFTDEIVAFKPNENEDQNIYWSITFKWSVKEMFYSGDDFIEVDEKSFNDSEEVIQMIERMVEGKGFFPTIVETIESMIPKDSFEYDYYSMGEDGFTLFWSINKTVLMPFIKKVKAWVNYLEIGELVKLKEVYKKLYTLGNYSDEVLVNISSRLIKKDFGGIAFKSIEDAVEFGAKNPLYNDYLVYVLPYVPHNNISDFFTDEVSNVEYAKLNTPNIMTFA